MSDQEHHYQAGTMPDPLCRNIEAGSETLRMPDSDVRVGFISPHSHNFCSTCNRVRVTVEGRLLLCLGKGMMRLLDNWRAKLSVFL